MEKIFKQREIENEIIDNSVKRTSFPVPTMSNPKAVFVDDEARTKAIEKILDKNENMNNQQHFNEDILRKERLAILREKMNKARNENQLSMMEEFKRKNDPEFLMKQRELAKEEQNAKLRLELEAKGIDKNKGYLIQTAEIAENREKERFTKHENLVKQGWESFNFENHHLQFESKISNKKQKRP